MCSFLDQRPVEYTVNVIDIGTDFFFAYWIFERCFGWSIGIIVCLFLGIIGVIMKMICQSYKIESINPETNIKELRWKRTICIAQCGKIFLFGTLFEQLFEGLFVGIIEAIIVGEAMDTVGCIKIIIKALYFIYAIFKYGNLSYVDSFKAWLLTLTLTTSMIWFGCAVSTISGFVSNTPVANCV